MSSDHEAEIRASVAAHADLGPGYDDAVAEGLVERIGAEIDKRIDARLVRPVCLVRAVRRARLGRDRRRRGIRDTRRQSGIRDIRGTRGTRV